MRKLPVNLDIEAGSKFLQEDQMTPFMKAHVVYKPGTAKILDTKNKLLRILRSFKLYIHVSEMT